MIALNNVTTKAAYDATTTREQPETVRLTLEVFGPNSILYALKDPIGNSWGEDVHAAPGRYALERRCSGIRLKDYAAGSHAQVTAVLLRGDEIP